MCQLSLARRFCTILLIKSIFLATIEGAPLCDSGQLNETTIKDEIVNPTNERRSKVAKGEQTNGGGDNLPPAQSMNQISWDCDLEAKSTAILNSQCLDTVPISYSGNCGIYITFNDYYEIGDFFEHVLENIDFFALDSTTDDVKYSEEFGMEQYANLINAKITAIGCTFAKCIENGNKLMTVFCLTDQSCLQKGDVIYERMKSTASPTTTTYSTTSTSDSTSTTSFVTNGANSESSSTDSTLITSPITTSITIESTEAASTKSDTSTASTGETASTGTSVTTTTNILTTEATLPSATSASSSNTQTVISSTGITTEEPNTMCPNNDGMTDSLRIAILAKHNGLRSTLALGAVNNGKTNNTCRKASKMPTLVYCCELEKSAIDRAKLCDQMGTVPQSNLVENNYNFTNNLNRTLVTAANNAAQLWWSEITKLESGIDQIQNLYYTHLGINSFAKMASDLTTGVGCAVVHCGNRINVVCHYDTTLANAVKLYTCGPTCNRCENGTNSCVNGLCPAASETCSVATTTTVSEATTTTAEPNTLCPNNHDMTDPLRFAILAKHNSLRTALALGTVENGQTGIMCRKASKMPTLTYSCNLECTALARATKCSQMDSTPPQCISENSYNFTKNLNRTLSQAANAATQVWWSELAALESGIDQIQNLFYTHLGISSFAKIASDLTTKIGCAVVHCNDLINVVCHYQTNLTNAVKLYTAGPTCKKCENGTDSCVNALCPASSE